MGILVDRKTRVAVQGITGKEGSYHTRLMLQYGTNIVAGCSPGKGGQEVLGVPVYDTLEEGVRYEKVEASIIMVPPRFAVDALYEAAEAGVKLIVCITEGIPLQDTMVAFQRIRFMCPDTKIIGPNSPGIIAPGKALLGIMPGNIFQEGEVGIISRSGTLTYQVAYELSQAGIGQSTVVGVGGDPLIGMRFIDLMELFRQDTKTRALCIIGEIGGRDEEEAADYIKKGFEKPLVAYVAGQTAPPGKKMGHAGAIASEGEGTARSKSTAFKRAGAFTVDAPYQVVDAFQEVF
ncbi:MAG: succinate--CoA ligase subunit alpha [Candidatus Syntrophonatronum acetioxidans]|uniref:Succinate--CoA ligase [ADP-forming] subunit alpha n=1 Tax=Candidatus Syntrophonatronum acetioxidans TaxID=1795816 RepID=A0A424YF64_9FIRM|nr:MAG: succinate--CoA ligase subunit alpha [Candidatus Syntrophonatronum acetioxidans]